MKPKQKWIPTEIENQTNAISIRECHLRLDHLMELIYDQLCQPPQINLETFSLHPNSESSANLLTTEEEFDGVA